MEIKLKIDDQKNHRREYDISGDISLQNINIIVDDFKKVLPDCTDLTINLKNITGFDTAAFQLFYSIKNSFIRDKKKYKVTCSINEETQTVLNHSGIDNLAAILSIQTNE
ncbi:MAG: hypothetical protein MJ211_12900 [Bacteroidales bacterium]|nr:hypothetical protein [Bacteroidales bacterium]